MADYLFEKPQNNTVHDISIKEIDLLFRDNLREEREGHRITSSAQNKEYNKSSKNLRYELYKDDLYTIPKTDGYLMQYPHGIVIEQSMRRNFYRGENQIYKASIPSLSRALSIYKTKKEKELYRLVADMRIAEFEFFLNKFAHVKNWKHCDVLYDTIAQHYGFQTNWLDITSDFNVAMFFATCYFDGKQWHPLTTKQTEVDESRQFGMIFHAPSFQMSERWLRANNWFSSQGPYNASTGKHDIFPHPHCTQNLENLTFPIGFQPFMRCHMQNGYAIYMREPRPLQQDFKFEKLRFKHSEDLSKRFFDLMEGGKKIYPHEGLLQANFILSEMKNLTSFSKEAFQHALYCSHYYRIADEEQCRADLSEFLVDGNHVYIQETHPWSISAGRKKKIDELYDDFSVESSYGIQIGSKMVLGNDFGMFAPWMLPEDKGELGVIDFSPRPIEAYCDNIFNRNSQNILFIVEYAQMPDF